MDAFFDSVTTSSSSSTPQTPSPRLDQDLNPPFADSPADYQPTSFALDYDPEKQSQFWPVQNNIPPRGFLSELYDGQMKVEDPVSYPSSNWQPGPQFSPDSLTPPEPQFYRRSSFPFVHHDFDDAPQDSHFYPPPKYIFGDPLPVTADPSALSHNPDEQPFVHSSSPPRDYEEQPENVKVEHSSPVIVPSQLNFYRPSSSSSSISNASAPSFIPQHASLPIMHTDDSASKETQYLRRRCFNCHTTEPPSWRRSTLNPGKIVCNKCGLYERTHNCPRPHRFDELRAGNKARKAPKSHNPSPTQNLKPKQGLVKKEPKDDLRPDPRRGSVVSLNSGSGQSDWDDSASSAYPSASSAPTSSFNSPLTQNFNIPQSQSPPATRDGPIRLPQAPLTDIAARLKSPAKAQSAPYPYPPPLGRPIPPSADYFARRGSYDHNLNALRRHTMAAGMPEVTGWQSVPLDLSVNPARKTRKIAA